MTAQLITSLAILKVNFDRGGQDYVGNFVPLVAEVMRLASADVVSANDVQNALKSDFGLDVPQGAVRTILRRVSAEGYAAPVANSRYARNMPRLDGLNFVAVRDAALRKQRALVRRFMAFAQSDGSSITTDSAERLLTTYVQKRGPYLLRSLIRSDQLLPEISGQTDEALVHAFVSNVVGQDPQGFDELETFVKGSILYGAIFLPNLGGVTRRFHGLEVYFDTRILLRALGLAGPVTERPARELLELCYELGATLLCFDSTLSEMIRVLTAVENSLRYRQRLREHTSEILEYLASQGSRPSDVALTIERLPAMLRSLRVGVVDRPLQSSRLAVNEVGLANELRTATHQAYSEDAIGHDVDALTAIHRLRRGESKVVLEAAGAVFVTTNRLLKAIGNRQFAEHSGPQDVPLVFDEDEFATISWLKKPTGAPALPLGLAIANSYAASSPAPEVWRLYLSEIDRLEAAGEISEDEYYALRFSTSAKDELSQRRRRSEPVNTATVLDILQRVRDQIRSELRPEVERQVTGTTEAVSRGRIAQADTEAQAAGSGLRRLSNSVAQERLRRHERFREFASTAARRLMRLVKLPVVVAIVGFGYVSLEPAIRPIVPATIQLDVPEWLRIAAAVAALFLLLLGSMSLISGTSLNSMLRSVEVGLASRIERWLSRTFG